MKLAPTKLSVKPLHYLHDGGLEALCKEYDISESVSDAIAKSTRAVTRDDFTKILDAGFRLDRDFKPFAVAYVPEKYNTLKLL